MIFLVTCHRKFHVFHKKAILVGHVINQGRNIYNGVYLQRSLAKLPKQHKPARALTQLSDLPY